jgi:8-oxo-dGTP pyrophosphatase MutT (NUDIX family)
VRSRELVYENRYQRISRVCVDFGSFEKEYFVTDTGIRAGIVALRGDSVLLVRQYRLLIDGLSWEIPGGKVDDGETPAEAALRECLEETGFRCLNLRPLLFYHVSLDTTYNPTHLFYSTEVQEQCDERHIHREEVSGAEWVPLGRCVEMIFNRQIVDIFSMIALLAYQKVAQQSKDV